MNTEGIINQLRMLWRADRIIADIRLQHLLIGLGLRAFAGLIAAFGLLMLELSAYFALVQIWSAIAAAAILGGINFAIAAILFVVANRKPSGREIELASEVHDAAMQALQLLQLVVRERQWLLDLAGHLERPRREVDVRHLARVEDGPLLGQVLPGRQARRVVPGLAHLRLCLRSEHGHRFLD